MDCPICFDAIGEGEGAQTACGHTFHADCLRQWSSSAHSNHRCPTCREPLEGNFVYAMRKAYHRFQDGFVLFIAYVVLSVVAGVLRNTMGLHPYWIFQIFQGAIMHLPSSWITAAETELRTGAFPITVIFIYEMALLVGGWHVFSTRAFCVAVDTCPWYSTTCWIRWGACLLVH